MDRESSGPEVEAFLRALSDELLIAPGDLSVRRHVSAAAAVARSARVRHQGTRIMVRKVAAVAAALSVIGTGGLATAGALPAPIQDAVARVADVIPLPMYVPYPEVEDPEAPEQVTVPEPALTEPAEPLAPEPVVIVETTIASESSVPTPTTTAVASWQDGDGGSACGDECRDGERDRSSAWSGSHDQVDGADGQEDDGDGGWSDEGTDWNSNDRRDGDYRRSDESRSREASDGDESDDRDGRRWGAGDEDDGRSGRRSEEGGSTQGSSWVGP